MGVSVGGSYSTYSAPIKSKNTLAFFQQSQLGTFSINKPISVQLTTKVQGVNNEGVPNPTTYEVVDGSLPSGVTLSSTGLLSGTIPDVPEGATYNFSVRATRSLFGTWVYGTIAFVITVTRASNDLIFELPLDGNLNATVGTSKGYIGNGGYGTFVDKDTLFPTSTKFLIAGTRNINNNRPTKFEVGSQFLFMKDSDFTIEFFMNANPMYSDPVSRSYPIFSLNYGFQMIWNFFSFYSQPDYEGGNAVGFSNYYSDTAPYKSKLFFRDPTTSVGNIGWKTFNHYAIVRSDDQLRIYVNGVTGGHGPSTVGGVNSIALSGDVPFLEFANCSVAKFRVYDYAKYSGNSITVPNDLDSFRNIAV